jgi:hypothetical protein
MGRQIAFAGLSNFCPGYTYRASRDPVHPTDEPQTGSLESAKIRIPTGDRAVSRAHAGNLLEGLGMDFNLKHDEHGSIMVQPVTDHSLFLFGATVVLLAVDFVREPRELHAGAEPQRVQLAMTPEKALALAKSLKETAKRARKRIARRRWLS